MSIWRSNANFSNKWDIGSSIRRVTMALVGGPVLRRGRTPRIAPQQQTRLCFSFPRIAAFRILCPSVISATNHPSHRAKGLHLWCQGRLPFGDRGPGPVPTVELTIQGTTHQSDHSVRYKRTSCPRETWIIIIITGHLHFITRLSCT